jgi:2-polyprenyl-3-methyl-5-hydroxy-6-metoxy-1,4-benzoquinol methylase
VRAEWDNRYSDRQQLWSGQPNGSLVAEVAGLTPGRVLNVGCGEGADAVWLARRGWDVTALEVSGVALERAAGHARDAGLAVHLSPSRMPRPLGRGVEALAEQGRE